MKDGGWEIKRTLHKGTSRHGGGRCMGVACEMARVMNEGRGGTGAGTSACDRDDVTVGLGGNAGPSH